MTLTIKQIKGAIAAHERRLQELRSFGYPEDHPLVVWNKKQLADLRRRVTGSELPQKG